MRTVRYVRDGRIRIGVETSPGTFEEAVETSMLDVLTTGATRSGVPLTITDPTRLELEGALLLTPIDPQEVWCAGLTYERAQEANPDPTVIADVYATAYASPRPELSFKDAMWRRTVGHGQPIAIRSDSAWTVPEPEIGLVLGPSGTILGVTIGNDVSSRDIEAENPLFLPQAKIYASACAIGPAIYAPEAADEVFEISMQITDQGGASVFAGTTSTALMRRTFTELVGWLLRDNPVPPGSILLTGTGLVPPPDVALRPGDIVEIHVPQIGTLTNPVVSASTLS